MSNVRAPERSYRPAPKSEQICVRLDEKTLRALRKVCRARKVTLAEFVRQAVMERAAGAGREGG